MNVIGPSRRRIDSTRSVVLPSPAQLWSSASCVHLASASTCDRDTAMGSQSDSVADVLEARAAAVPLGLRVGDDSDSDSADSDTVRESWSAGFTSLQEPQEANTNANASEVNASEANASEANASDHMVQGGDGGGDGEKTAQNVTNYGRWDELCRDGGFMDEAADTLDMHARRGRYAHMPPYSPDGLVRAQPDSFYFDNELVPGECVVVEYASESAQAMAQEINDSDLIPGGPASTYRSFGAASSSTN